MINTHNFETTAVVLASIVYCCKQCISLARWIVSLRERIIAIGAICISLFFVLCKYMHICHTQKLLKPIHVLSLLKTLCMNFIWIGEDPCSRSKFVETIACTFFILLFNHMYSLQTRTKSWGGDRYWE